MVLSPMIRGLLGIEAGDGGRMLTFAPQLPADWDQVTVRNVAAGGSRYDLALTREPGVVAVAVDRREGGADDSGSVKLVVAPAFPLDARVRSVAVDGRDTPFEIERRGDVQRAVVRIDPSPTGSKRSIAFAYDEGSEAFAAIETPARGATSEGLRILRSRAEGGVLHLILEGLAGRTYTLGVRSPRSVADAPAIPGVTVLSPSGGADPSAGPEPDSRSARAEQDSRPAGTGPAVAAGGARTQTRAGETALRITFEGPTGQYVRRTIDLPLR
jgi:hypothetical protein